MTAWEHSDYLAKLWDTQRGNYQTIWREWKGGEEIQINSPSGTYLGTITAQGDALWRAPLDGREKRRFKTREDAGDFFMSRLKR